TALAISLLTGCSLFATPSGDDAGNGGSSGAVKMTDSYTYEDPEDLDFDTRYVIKCDENTAMIAQIPAEYGVKASYSIIYARDDAPVADYEFFVCDSAEHAAAAAALYASQGQALQEAENDPCVLYAYSDGDTMEATLVTFQSYGMISEATVSAYVSFMQTNTGGTLME
ncbi:MAG: hypothetical protein K2G28_01620, partial [Acetatifactor sp.]|nr:hypothetical protein [Acetatifactor sp.]